MSSLIFDAKIAVTTTAGGAFTSTETRRWDGYYLEEIEYVIGTIDSGATVTISVTNRPSGVDLTLLTLSSPSANKIYRVRTSEHDNTGTALGSNTRYAIDGTLKVVVSAGGATKAGSVHFKMFK